EPVEKGEPLFELDTDKVTQEVEAEAAGVLLKIAVPEGDVPVGQTVAFIGAEGEDVPEVAAAAPPQEVIKPDEEEPAPAHEAPQDAVVASGNGRVKASPLARRIARERGVELSGIRGTGPDGRIVAEDVERAEVGGSAAPVAAPAVVSAGEVQRVPLSNVRKTIARRLTEAWQIPVFQLQASADMTRVNALVARLRERDPDVRITVTDVLTKVCAQALMRHREVNAEFTEEAILLHPSANVGLAVAAPQGLVVPVIRSAERLSLTEIAGVRADLVGRARENKLRADDLEGGTFTISNLGMYAVESFTAVLNPPQAAIVAVGATEERVVAIGGETAVRPTVTLTCTFDHRAVDGAPAAAFLQTLKESLEDPGLAL
ncbi:MAG TPA: dihydrolipoamide acetyltransferase family protein, partial [Thermoanaerobaculia bacterium]|nr:dihydrolipoamide acetyltransferase family protein [Thermoanaerobaculia bacterium]